MNAQPKLVGEKVVGVHTENVFKPLPEAFNAVLKLDGYIVNLCEIFKGSMRGTVQYAPPMLKQPGAANDGYSVGAIWSWTMKNSYVTGSENNGARQRTTVYNRTCQVLEVIPNQRVTIAVVTATEKNVIVIGGNEPSITNFVFEFSSADQTGTATTVRCFAECAKPPPPGFPCCCCAASDAQLVSMMTTTAKTAFDALKVTAEAPSGPTAQNMHNLMAGAVYAQAIPVQASKAQVAPMQKSLAEEIQSLHDLKNAGALTEEQYQAALAKLTS